MEIVILMILIAKENLKKEFLISQVKNLLRILLTGLEKNHYIKEKILKNMPIN
jgi:hypothetical protein